MLLKKRTVILKLLMIRAQFRVIVLKFILMLIIPLGSVSRVNRLDVKRQRFNGLLFVLLIIVLLTVKPRVRVLHGPRLPLFLAILMVIRCPGLIIFIRQLETFLRPVVAVVLIRKGVTLVFLMILLFNGHPFHLTIFGLILFMIIRVVLLSLLVKKNGLIFVPVTVVVTSLPFRRVIQGRVILKRRIRLP